MCFCLNNFKIEVTAQSPAPVQPLVLLPYSTQRNDKKKCLTHVDHVICTMDL